MHTLSTAYMELSLLLSDELLKIHSIECCECDAKFSLRGSIFCKIQMINVLLEQTHL